MEQRTKKLKAACYCRVSTKKDDQLDSLEKQRAFFARFFENNPEYELYELYADEGVSAKSMKNRRRFAKLLDDARAGRFQALFVKDVSRFARNVQDFFYALTVLEDCGVRVHFVTLNLKSEQASRFTLGMMALLAEDESQRLSVKVKFGKCVTARRGRVPNFVFGYDRTDVYTLRPNPQEAEWVRRVFSLYVSGEMGTAKIAALLNEQGVPSKRGNVGSWTQASVAKILRNELYVGRVINLRTEVRDFKTGARDVHRPEDWAVTERADFALIDRELFDGAQRLLSMRGTVGGSRRSAAHPLSNLLVCAEDGRPFRRVSRGGASWVCSIRNAKGTSACENATRINEAAAHRILTELLRTVFAKTPGSTAKLIAAVKKTLGEREKRAGENPLPALEAKKRRLTELYADGLLSKEEATESLTKLTQKISQLKKEKKFDSARMDVDEWVTMKIETLEMKGLLTNGLLKSIFLRVEVDREGGVRATLHSGKTIQIFVPNRMHRTQGYVGASADD